jgi:hypothetical protein
MDIIRGSAPLGKARNTADGSFAAPPPEVKCFNFRNTFILGKIIVGKDEFNFCPLDTGSSDSWIRKTLRPDELLEPRREKIINYAGGLAVTGLFIEKTVILGGLLLNRQSILAIPDTGMSANWGQDSTYIPNCVIALALTGRSSSDSIVASLRSQQEISNFSLAVSRIYEPPGKLVMNRMPASPIKYDSSWATVRVIQHSPTDVHRGAWMIQVDGFDIPAGDHRNQPVKDAIVDSGSGYLVLPPGLAMSIISKWPGAIKEIAHKNTETRWMVSCNETPPKIGVILGGNTIYIEPEDMIIRDEVENGCLAAILVHADKRVKPLIGLPFLTNAVVVFDTEGKEMRFYQRRR